MQAGSNFPADFVRPGFRHVAVAADCPNSSAVIVMYGLLVLLVDIVFHDVAGNTKILGIRQVHRRIETAPEYDASDEHQESADGNSKQVFHGGLAP